LREGLIKIIKFEIEDSFGRKVLSARDCQELTGEIYLKTGQRIHTNTLRRLFGIIKANYNPSLSTLLILARYCGYNSLDELKESAAEESDTENKVDPSNVLRFLYVYFQQTQVTGYNDTTFLSQMPILIRFINHNIPVAEKISKLVAKTRNGQDFYFEQCINIDRLDSYYGDGLRYYLSEKTTTEARLFGHGMLALRAFLIMDDKQLEREYKEVISIKLDDSIHPFMKGRYYAVCLYHAHVKGQETRGIIKKAAEVYADIKKPVSKAYELFPTFSQALTLTGHFHEALSFIDLRKKLPNRGTEIDKSANEIYDLLNAFAHSRVGNKKAAADIIRNINPTEFNFLSRKYKTILYLLTTLEINRTAGKLVEQLKHLLETTGFRRLERLMSKQGL
jgi:hypothetical protein